MSDKVISMFSYCRFILKFLWLRYFFKYSIVSKGYIGSQLGAYSKIIMKGSSKLEVSKNFKARDFLYINLNNGRLRIGNEVFFNNFVSINCRCEVYIGDDCLFGEGVKVYDHNHRFRKLEPISSQGFKMAPIIIGNNVWIGSNSIILSGVSIGSNSVISAGSVVKEDLPPDSILHIGGIIEKVKRL